MHKTLTTFPKQSQDAAIHKAALNESAAAGILHISGWVEACEKARSLGGHKHKLPILVDPMCGSGTLLVEAALVAGMVAPGLVRMVSISQSPHSSDWLPIRDWHFFFYN
jgi:23S rRNA G2445 N2-methylase RlmL